jgi:hypothetical protein
MLDTICSVGYREIVMRAAAVRRYVDAPALTENRGGQVASLGEGRSRTLLS